MRKKQRRRIENRELGKKMKEDDGYKKRERRCFIN